MLVISSGRLTVVNRCLLAVDYSQSRISAISRDEARYTFTPVWNSCVTGSCAIGTVRSQIRLYNPQ
jgi:hypothetical protein